MKLSGNALMFGSISTPKDQSPSQSVACQLSFLEQEQFLAAVAKTDVGPLTQRHELQNEQARLRPLKWFKADASMVF